MALKNNNLSKALDIVIPVYNDNPYLEETLKSIFIQQLPNGWKVNVYIVDDGSDEPVAVDNKGVNVVRLEKNSGCSVARNQGARAGNGEVILFLDADCSLMKEDTLALLLEEYEKGYDVCFGQIHAPQGDFWAKYQNDVAKERAVRFFQGEHSSMTTSIFMSNRKAFESVGGFDEAYHFGFEDRDLFITLNESGARVSLVESAKVNHNDALTLISVTEKMYKAGAESSSRFIEKHTKHYEEMAYVRADVRYSGFFLKLVVMVTKPVLWTVIGYLNWVIKKEILPFWALRRVVKYISGLAYLHGTALAVR
ncbi:MAG: glycosyltransferase [Cycloclasticus sp.]|nr:glycosyltransferase [Cycloclasticus sp.]